MQNEPNHTTNPSLPAEAEISKDLREEPIDPEKKEEEAQPEDFDRFDVDKVEKLNKTKEKNQEKD
jgi:hypothetical protein